MEVASFPTRIFVFRGWHRKSLEIGEGDLIVGMIMGHVVEPRGGHSVLEIQVRSTVLRIGWSFVSCYRPLNGAGTKDAGGRPRGARWRGIGWLRKGNISSDRAATFPAVTVSLSIYIYSFIGTHPNGTTEVICLDHVAVELARVCSRDALYHLMTTIWNICRNSRLLAGASSPVTLHTQVPVDLIG
jgi:hypothetical protein